MRVSHRPLNAAVLAATTVAAAGWTGGPVGERALMNDLENDWGNFSTWADKKLKNQPADPHTIGGKTFATLDAAQEYLTIVKP